MCWEWINSSVMYIVGLLVDVMFKKDCVECVIKFLYRPEICQAYVLFHLRNDVMFPEA